MINEKELIERQFNNIFVNLWGIDFDAEKYDKKAKFLSSNIGMAPRDLVVLLYEIEKKFDIYIDNQFLINGKFDCFSSIAAEIEEKVSNKKAEKRREL